MKLRVLGPYGGELPGCFLSGFLLDETVLIDAGTVSLVLDQKEQSKIEHVLISHPHLDHIGALPHMAVNVFANDSNPVYVYGLKTTLEALNKHILNNVIWPDFTKINRPNGKAVFELVKLEEGQESKIGAYTVRAIRVNHPVPTCGFIISREGKSIAYSGDTGATEEFWEAVSDAPNLRGIICEVSFPNRLQKLAEITGHLTPEGLRLELKKVRRKLTVPVIAFHIKPEYEKEIRKELKDSEIVQVEVAKTDKVFSF
jgi:ribonuclease BN (tRNA processing enzyme)